MQSLAHPPTPNTRELRALELYEIHGHRIERIAPDVYLVPSCTGSGAYRVDYAEESCSCPDYARRGPGVNCKHVLAVGITRASRRSGVREVRALRVAAGDPFAYAGKRRQGPCAPCSGCGRRFPARELVECDEGNHDNLTYFHGDRLCRRCADNASVAY